MRLQKYIAQAGIASRRKAEEFIERGLVLVNGEVATIGMSVDSDVDHVEIGDEIVQETKEFVYYAFNKPRDIVTTCKSDDETGILDIIDIKERVFPIGRLDKETTGLILLTNDGRLSNFLMHPSHEHEKEYVVEVYGKIEDEALERMRLGVTIEIKENTRDKKRALVMKPYRTRPCLIERISSSKFSIVLKEGKNRQIRRMVKVVGHDVKKLKRIRVENVHLGNLLEGTYRPLTKHEKEDLFNRV